MSELAMSEDEYLDHVVADWIECYLCGGEGTYECENPLECCDGEHTCQHCGGRGGFDANEPLICPVCSEPTDTLPHTPCTDGRDDEQQPY